MTHSASPSVLRRKVKAPVTKGAGGAMTPVKALGQALAKTAQDLMGLALDVVTVTEVHLSIAEIPEQLVERSLLAVLAGPEESLGLMALSPATLATLIEMQTTGRIGAATVQPRRPTRTDAAMSARFINNVLTELDVILATHPAVIWAGGFRYSSYLDDPRPLGLLLEDAPFRGFQIRLRLGGADGRESDLFLVFPAEGRGTAPTSCDVESAGHVADTPGGSQVEWSDRIEQAVLGVRAQVEVVLDRLSVPLAEVLALRKGSVLNLPAHALGHVRVEGWGGRFVTYGKLGQCQGRVAVRMLAGAQEDSEDHRFLGVDIPAANSDQ